MHTSAGVVSIWHEVHKSEIDQHTPVYMPFSTHLSQKIKIILKVPPELNKN